MGRIKIGGKKKTWEMEDPHAQVLRLPSFHPFFFFFSF